MTGVEAPFVLPWIVLAAAWLCLALLALAIHRLARPLLARIDAVQRSTLLLALCLLPITVATLVAVLAFAPRVGGVLVDEHCHADVGCVAHVPILHTTAEHAGLLAAALFVATGSLVWSIGSRLRRSVVLASTLSELADRSAREPFKIVESRERFAYCVGLLKPQVLVSRGVLDLPAAQRDAVLAHERAHAWRRDNLRRWLAGVSLWPAPERVRRALLEDLAEANEQACDRAASAACGQRAVLDALEALTPTALNVGARAGCVAHVANRLRSLDEDPAPVAMPAVLAGAVVLAAYAACALAALDAAHHGSELVLGWIG